MVKSGNVQSWKKHYNTGWRLKKKTRQKSDRWSLLEAIGQTTPKKLPRLKDAENMV